METRSRESSLFRTIRDTTPTVETTTTTTVGSPSLCRGNGRLDGDDKRRAAAAALGEVARDLDLRAVRSAFGNAACLHCISLSLSPVALYRISVHSPVEEMREQAHDKGKLIDRHVTGPFSNCPVLFSRSNSSFSSAPTSVSRFFFCTFSKADKEKRTREKIEV